MAEHSDPSGNEPTAQPTPTASAAAGSEAADDATEPIDDGNRADDAGDESTRGHENDADRVADGGTEQVGLDTEGATVGSDGASDTPDIDGGSFIDGPETDQEMPLADHIEEMMRRLGIVFLFAGVATVITYPLAADIINYLWASHIPSAEFNRPRLYGPLEFILTKLKVAGLAGLLVGLPMFVYQTYRFMAPGLYDNERRYYLAAVPTSLVLGVVGVLFAHFLILPFIFSYFTGYTEPAAVIAFGLQETFNLILIMMAWMALVFQIPLFIMLAIMMGLVTREWLEAKRLIFWGVFLAIAFVFSPDPTGMAPIIVTLTMVGLFEGTLALLRWTGN